MPLSDLFSLILMGAASILSIALIFFLKNISNSFTILTENITALRSEITPVLKNVTEVTEKINAATDEIQQPLKDVLNTVYEIRKKMSAFFDYEEKIRNNISSSMLGVLTGIKTFWSSYRHNGRDRMLEYHTRS